VRSTQTTQTTATGRLADIETDTDLEDDTKSSIAMPSLPPSPARRHPPLPSPTYLSTGNGAASLSPSAAENNYRLPSMHSAFDQVRERTLSSTSVSTVGARVPKQKAAGVEKNNRPPSRPNSGRPSSRGIASKDVAKQADPLSVRPRSARPQAVAHSGSGSTSLSPAPTLASLYLVAGLPKEPVRYLFRSQSRLLCTFC
jgi:hypothetical protein